MKIFLIGVILFFISEFIYCQKTIMLFDERDGKSYKTVCINGVVWMAENLAYEPENGNFWAYDNDNDNVKSYGFLYDWETSQNVCPDGWLLPNIDKFEQLINLKPDSFNLLFGGYGYGDEDFTQLGTKGYWWSSTVGSDDGSYEWYYILDSDFVVNYSLSRYNSYSVRCIKD